MQLDEFESRFKRAAREVFEYREVTYARVLLVTDLPADKGGSLAETVKGFGGVADDAEARVLDNSVFPGLSRILQELDDFKPDLIVSYRMLNYKDKSQGYTLGVYIDILTQATSIPVMLLPSVEDAEFDALVDHTDKVMVVADHLQGDYRLIDQALPFTRGTGRLELVHIEEEQIFERYMSSIEKIPSISSQEARVEILETLLKEPADYIASCVKDLEGRFPELSVESTVRLGGMLGEIKKLIDRSSVGLVVANTKDDQQLAMHGEAYALAVELRKIPLLLL
jgi:hypothetical protein